MPILCRCASLNFHYELAPKVNYTSWETAINVAFRLDDIEPDLLIIYHAMNDINPRLIHPDDYVGLNLSRGIWQPDTSPVPWSALYRFITLRLGLIEISYDQFDTQFQRVSDVRTCGGFEERDGQQFCINLDMPILDVLAANPPTYFERNLRMIATLAASKGWDVMFVGWAYSPLEYPEDVGGLYFTYDFTQQAVQEHNLITEQVAHEIGIPFYDFPSEMPQEKKWWVDGMHVNANGARLQAELFAQFIVENNLISE